MNIRVYMLLETFGALESELVGPASSIIGNKYWEAGNKFEER